MSIKRYRVELGFDSPNTGHAFDAKTHVSADNEEAACDIAIDDLRAIVGPDADIYCYGAHEVDQYEAEVV